MNVIYLTSRLSGMSYPPCHVERSETSLDKSRHTAAANDLRFFSRDCGIRMTSGLSRRLELWRGSASCEIYANVCDAR